MAAGAPAAQERFELENNIQAVSDALFEYDEAAHLALCEKKPWKSNPLYFKRVYVCATALIKMVMHARSGGNLEVMGIMQGYVKENAMVVTDAFPLPVEGIEYRVDLGPEGDEYLINYLDAAKPVKRFENSIGWYHSHPGFRPFLSGTDVTTQHNWQTYSDPWLAVVVDPLTTMSAGKVDIGAFRLYPQGYKPTTPPKFRQDSKSIMSIRSDKEKDYGAHSDRYYELDMQYYKSTTQKKLLDILWLKFWVQTLSSSSLLVNRDYHTGRLKDVAEKLERLDVGSSNYRRPASSSASSSSDSTLSTIAADCVETCSEHACGMMTLVCKHILFNVMKAGDTSETAGEKEEKMDVGADDETTC
mmetsp:Transcript_21468/g.54112  ORF Transcript_21468/g.54112 Transcript_21468/m.54112 type:complete len:359 (-) Transcript_21468:62-1138(-)